MDYFFKKEQLPPNWYSRIDPYTVADVTAQIELMYALHPVAFGGNTGKPNSFVGIGNFGTTIQNNMFNGTAAGVACLLYQAATENMPASTTGAAGTNPPTANLQWAASKLNPLFSSGTFAAACPINFNNA